MVQGELRELIVETEQQQSIIPDPWLGQHLNQRAYKVLPPEDDSLAAELKQLPAVPSFLFSKVQTTDHFAMGQLEANGFRLIDTNVTLSMPMPGFLIPSTELEIGPARPEEEAAVTQLAEEAFIYTRFHLDPLIDNAIANQLKGAWVNNFFHGKRGEHLWLARSNGRVVGFLQLLSREGVLTIDLIATHPDYRKQGIAKQLIMDAGRNLPGHITYRVGTQLANVPSIRLYQKLGFLMEGSSYVFHLHLNQP